MISPLGSISWTGPPGVLMRCRFGRPSRRTIRPPTKKLPMSRTERAGLSGMSFMPTIPTSSFGIVKIDSNQTCLVQFRNLRVLDRLGKTRHIGLELRREFLRRAADRLVADSADAFADLGGEDPRNLLMNRFDDFARRACGHEHAVPARRFETTPARFGHCRHVGQRCRAFEAGRAQGAQ